MSEEDFLTTTQEANVSYAADYAVMLKERLAVFQTSFLVAEQGLPVRQIDKEIRKFQEVSPSIHFFPVDGPDVTFDLIAIHQLRGTPKVRHRGSVPLDKKPILPCQRDAATLLSSRLRSRWTPSRVSNQST